MENEGCRRNCVIVAAVKDNFVDPNHRKYKCCCGSVRSTTGALIVGTLHLLGTIFTTGWMIFARSAVESMENVAACIEVIGAIFICFELITTFLLFLGIIKNNHHLVIPYFVYQIFNTIIHLIVAIVLLVVLIVAAIDLNGEYGDVMVVGVIYGWILAVVIILGSIIECWFLAIVHSAYRYLRDVVPRGIQDGHRYPMEQSGIVTPKKPVLIPWAQPNTMASAPPYCAIRKSESTKYLLEI